MEEGLPNEKKTQGIPVTAAVGYHVLLVIGTRYAFSGNWLPRQLTTVHARHQYTKLHTNFAIVDKVRVPAMYR